MRIRHTICFSLLVVAGTVTPSARPATLNLSRDLVSLGISPTNLAPSDPTIDAGPLLLKGIDYAKSHGIALVTVDKGVYYFKSLEYADRHVDLYKADNMTIDFGGSDLVLRNRQHLGIVLDQCTNTTLQNFTIDFNPLPFTQVRITRVDATQRRLLVDALSGWPDPTTLNASENAYGLSEDLWLFVFRNGEPVRDIDRLQVQRPMMRDQVTIVDQNLPWTESDILNRIQPGDIAVLTARGAGEPVLVDHGNSVTLRNIDVFSSGINGIAVYASANTSIERIYVRPKPATDRLVSSNADGITVSQPGPNNVVRLSRAIRTLDDGLSPHSLVYGTVTNRIDSRTVDVRRQFTIEFPNGVPIAFQDASDGHITANATIISQDPPFKFFPQAGETVRLTLDQDVPELPAGTAFYATDPTQRGTNMRVERNAVEDQVFARGVTLWGFINLTVSGNYINNTPMAGIFGVQRLFQSDWMSPPLKDVVITNNVIDGAIVGYGQGELEKMAAIQFIAQRSDFQPMSVSPHTNVRITNNIVQDSRRSAIRIENVTAGDVADNSVVNSAINPFADGYWEDSIEPYRSEFTQPIVIKSSADVALNGNTTGSGVVRIAVTDPNGIRLSAYAPSTSIILSAPGIGTIPSGTTGTAHLVDADGTETTLPIRHIDQNNVSTVIPDHAALGGACIRISGQEQMSGTLFIDSEGNFPLPTFSGARHRAVHP